jgi:hypothetical protein
MLIISAVVVLVVVMAGCGTAMALLGRGGADTSGALSGLPSPTPGTSPSPIASPTSSTKGATTVSADTVTVPLPAGWTVDIQGSELIRLLNPNSTGQVTISSGPSNPKMSSQQFKDDVDRVLRSEYPDTVTCPGSKTTTGNLNGAQGVFWNLCFTMTSPGNSFPAAALLFAGANSSGSVNYLVLVVTSQRNLQSFTSEVQPVVQGIQWKLK